MSIAKELYQIYKKAGLFNRIYISIRLNTCPFMELEKHIPKSGKIIDLGCGIGLLAHIMAICSQERIIEGVDYSENRIKIAQQTVSDKRNLTFFVKSIYDFNGYDYDTIIITDVLYLIPFQRQEEILRACFKKLNRNGLLIIKEMNTRPYWKRLLNLIQETLIVKVLKFTPTQHKGFFFRNPSKYKKLLSMIGFEIATLRLDKRRVYPHIVYICKKVKQENETSY